MITPRIYRQQIEEYKQTLDACRLQLEQSKTDSEHWKREAEKAHELVNTWKDSYMNLKSVIEEFAAIETTNAHHQELCQKYADIIGK